MGRKNYLIDTNITIYYFGLLLSKKSEIFIDDIVKDITVRYFSIFSLFCFYSSGYQRFNFKKSTKIG